MQQRSAGRALVSMTATLLITRLPEPPCRLMPMLRPSCSWPAYVMELVYEFMYAVLAIMSTLSPSWLCTPLKPFHAATLFATRMRPPHTNSWLRCSEMPFPSSMRTWIALFVPTQLYISLKLCATRLRRMRTL